MRFTLKLYLLETDWKTIQNRAIRMINRRNLPIHLGLLSRKLGARASFFEMCRDILFL